MPRFSHHSETIAAIATAGSNGSIGVVRISGSQVAQLCADLFEQPLTPRVAALRWVRDAQGEPLDQVVALRFIAPRSFTGEDVLELQGHASSTVLNMLLQRVLELGARQARPGEFSERAFINGRMDLAQAEAVADLIASSTEHAARAALRSLQGAFSEQVALLQRDLTNMRVQLEGSLDFSEEELEWANETELGAQLDRWLEQLSSLQSSAQTGQRLRDGISIALIGEPNVGKSSLMNHLVRNDVSIVTEVPGTTRDIVCAHINLEGLSVELLDTAGLRDTDDRVEREGVRRAQEVRRQADLSLAVFDASAGLMPSPALLEENPAATLLVANKIDCCNGIKPGLAVFAGFPGVYVSALTGAGVEILCREICQRFAPKAGFEGSFSARRRHLQALLQAGDNVRRAKSLLVEQDRAELVAEELRLAQHAMGEILGTVTSDDLLGEIFAGFCIGK